MATASKDHHALHDQMIHQTAAISTANLNKAGRLLEQGEDEMAVMALALQLCAGSGGKAVNDMLRLDAGDGSTAYAGHWKCQELSPAGFARIRAADKDFDAVRDEAGLFVPH